MSNVNVHCSLHSAAEERGELQSWPAAVLQKLCSPAHAGTNYELSTSKLGAMQRRCAPLCTFRTALAPKLRIKTFGNIGQGRPLLLPMILDPRELGESP